MKSLINHKKTYIYIILVLANFQSLKISWENAQFVWQSGFRDSLLESDFLMIEFHF